MTNREPRSPTMAPSTDAERRRARTARTTRSGALLLVLATVFAPVVFLDTSSVAEAQGSGGTTPRTRSRRATPPPASDPAPAPEATAPSPTPTPAIAPEHLSGDDALAAADAADAESARERRLAEEAETPAPTTRSNSPHEEPGVAYRSIGLAYRHAFVPQRMAEVVLADAPRGLRVPQVALEFGRRRDGVQVLGSITYADYSFHGAFLQDGDPPSEYEWLDSSLKSVGLGASIAWSSNFSDVFALEYGLDFGLGALFGRVNRTEAYPSNGDNPRGGHGFAPCSAPTSAGQPGSASPAGDFDSSRFGGTDAASFCGAPAPGTLTDGDTTNGEQYGVHYRTWLDGGSLPFISWRLAPRLSLRIKPVAAFIMRIDFGFDLGSGLFVGGAAHYGF